ncbi:hypothetical protein BKA64DRAFT_117225 [Cadophora sp. MPI-SDFR-AT-0126]|nr:hypothetical protein BKA64DRAFT_117225 [Leotiomycetes sp. MPI-SDFR-AT-0126]
MVCHSTQCVVGGQEVVKVMVCHNTTLPTLNPSVKVVPLTNEQMPGVRCGTCAGNGQDVWVIPGKACPVCGTPC